MNFAATPPLATRHCFTYSAPVGVNTLSLHDALPIWTARSRAPAGSLPMPARHRTGSQPERSEEHTAEPSHGYTSYAVFRLKKKKRAHEVAGEIGGGEIRRLGRGEPAGGDQHGY